MDDQGAARPAGTVWPGAVKRTAMHERHRTAPHRKEQLLVIALRSRLSRDRVKAFGPHGERYVQWIAMRPWHYTERSVLFIHVVQREKGEHERFRLGREIGRVLVQAKLH